MSSHCILSINGQTVRAHVGETLVDAGLGGRILVPHDCCSGQCDTCRVRVVSGDVDDQGTADGDTVLACQATVEGDAAIEFDEVPVVSRRCGTVTEITPLCPNILEVVVRLRTPLDVLPGQYVSVSLAGFPARDFSPAPRLDGRLDTRELAFHIKRYPGGIVSGELGRTIHEGHKVQVRGPFGHAFLREGSGPLILISGGTGWAPIWALARTAALDQRWRDLIVIAGARDMDGLYMQPALDWLADNSRAEIIATAEFDAAAPARPGRPTLYLPSLGPDDTVYVAGVPGLVDAVQRKARAAMARCYCDPFTPSAEGLSLVDRVRRLWRLPKPVAETAPEPVIAAAVRHEPLVAAGGRNAPSRRPAPAQGMAAAAARPAPPADRLERDAIRLNR